MSLQIPMRSAAKTKDDGFSLLEVVVAVAIFGAAATVLSAAFVNAMLARERAGNTDLLSADIQLVRMQLLLTSNIDDAEDGGEVTTLNSGEATWEAEIEPTNIVDLFQVNFTIEFSEPPEDQVATYSEQIYLLRPTWSEPDERSDLLQDKTDELLRNRNFDRF